jgi:hypothetical protein
VIEIIEPREVPLGGPRAMTVRRTLPSRRRSLIGAWCFADHYGPDDVPETGGMDVPPHPHTGLATASWLFTGEVEHRDSGGVHALVRPGELNLMSAGAGIAHSEVSTPGTRVLHGVQLWLALPEAARHGERAFHHHVPAAIQVGGATLRVFLGSVSGTSSPVPTATPLVGAEVVLAAGGSAVLDVDPAHEHGLLVDLGPMTLQDVELQRSELGYLAPGPAAIEVHNPGREPARALLLGGAPFGEQIVMWWNFVARSHEEIEAWRQEWQEHSARFGEVAGYEGPVQHLPAPALPHVRLRPRGTASSPS